MSGWFWSAKSTDTAVKLPETVSLTPTKPLETAATQPVGKSAEAPALITTAPGGAGALSSDAKCDTKCESKAAVQVAEDGKTESNLLHNLQTGLRELLDSHARTAVHVARSREAENHSFYAAAGLLQTTPGVLKTTPGVLNKGADATKTESISDDPVIVESAVSIATATLAAPTVSNELLKPVPDKKEETLGDITDIKILPANVSAPDGYTRILFTNDGMSLENDVKRLGNDVKRLGNDVKRLGNDVKRFDFDLNTHRPSAKSGPMYCYVKRDPNESPIAHILLYEGMSA
jgi:hypothetical protein